MYLESNIFFLIDSNSGTPTHTPQVIGQLEGHRTREYVRVHEFEYSM